MPSSSRHRLLRAGTRRPARWLKLCRAGLFEVSASAEFLLFQLRTAPSFLLDAEAKTNLTGTAKMNGMVDWLRRRVLASLLVVVGIALVVPALAQEKLQVAGIWTVPVEQQWVSRLHNALNAAEQRGEIDYVYS